MAVLIMELVAVIEVKAVLFLGISNAIRQLPVGALSADEVANEFGGCAYWA